jgi:hypothetical protein
MLIAIATPTPRRAAMLRRRHYATFFAAYFAISRCRSRAMPLMLSPPLRFMPIFCRYFAISYFFFSLAFAADYFIIAFDIYFLRHFFFSFIAYFTLDAFTPFRRFERHAAMLFFSLLAIISPLWFHTTMLTLC